MTQAGAQTIRVANAPCSWGALEFDVGESLPYQQVLDEMAATGFAGTELGDWGFMPSDPASLRAELAARKLELVGAFVPVALARREAHTPGRDAALRTARLLAAIANDFRAEPFGFGQGGAEAPPLPPISQRGHGKADPVIVLSDANGEIPERARRAGRITIAESLSPHAWDVFARGASDIARAVREETGLRTVFHPHCGGFVETGWELDALMERTDPTVLGLCLDTGHLMFGGSDPVGIAARYAARIWHVHFKDCEPEVAARSRSETWDYLTAVRHGVFCELGRGRVDFPAVVSTLTDAGYTGWIVVEQDVLPGLGRPAESAARNRAYLRQLGL
jgi:inosose dehydratase